MSQGGGLCIKYKMIVKQSVDGNWYVCKVTSSSTKGRIRGGANDSKKTYRNWFFVRYANERQAIIYGRTYCPKEFLGKRVRLKLEVIE